jgi:hypothetical protein
MLIPALDRPSAPAVADSGMSPLSISIARQMMRAEAHISIAPLQFSS